MTTYKNYPFLGFHDIFDILESGLPKQKTYPPYNIIRNDDTTVLEVAVAGFDREDLTVSVIRDRLVVARYRREEETDKVYLHKGISTRSFELKWSLDQRRLEVKDVKLENGILRITLQHIVPEEDKPRQIDIL